MARITGGVLRIAVGLVLISVVVFGAIATPDENAPVDEVLLDPGGLRQSAGPPPGVTPQDAGGGPWSGAGPGLYLAPLMMELADMNKDGRLTPEEAAAAASQVVRDADRDRTGSIDVDDLASGMNRRMALPPGVGPGGPGIGGPGRGGPRGWGAKGRLRPRAGLGTTGIRRATEPVPPQSSDANQLH